MIDIFLKGLLVRDKDSFRKCSIISCVTVGTEWNKVVMMRWVGNRGGYSSIVMEPEKEEEAAASM